MFRKKKKAEKTPPPAKKAPAPTKKMPVKKLEAAGKGKMPAGRSSNPSLAPSQPASTTVEERLAEANQKAVVAGPTPLIQQLRHGGGGGDGGDGASVIEGADQSVSSLPSLTTIGSPSPSRPTTAKSSPHSTVPHSTTDNSSSSSSGSDDENASSRDATSTHRTESERKSQPATGRTSRLPTPRATPRSTEQTPATTGRTPRTFQYSEVADVAFRSRLGDALEIALDRLLEWARSPTPGEAQSTSVELMEYLQAHVVCPEDIDANLVLRAKGLDRDFAPVIKLRQSKQGSLLEGMDRRIPAARWCLPGSITKVSQTALRKALPPRTALVEYVCGSDCVFVFVIGPGMGPLGRDEDPVLVGPPEDREDDTDAEGGVAEILSRASLGDSSPATVCGVDVVAATLEEVTGLASQYKSALTGGAPRSAKDKCAGELSRLLLSTRVANLLRDCDIDRVVFSPDGPLDHIPFHCLVWEDLPVLRRYEVSYVLCGRHIVLDWMEAWKDASLCPEARPTRDAEGQPLIAIAGADTPAIHRTVRHICGLLGDAVARHMPAASAFTLRGRKDERNRPATASSSSSSDSSTQPPPPGPSQHGASLVMPLVKPPAPLASSEENKGGREQYAGHRQKQASLVPPPGDEIPFRATRALWAGRDEARAAPEDDYASGDDDEEDDEDKDYGDLLPSDAEDVPPALPPVVHLVHGGVRFRADTAGMRCGISSSLRAGRLSLHDLRDIALITAPHMNMATMDPLYRAFFHAGVPTFIGTLWRVEDDFAAEFMSRVYLRLRDGERAAAAVRSTALDLLDEEKGLDLDSWAAFFCGGCPLAVAPLYDIPAVADPSWTPPIQDPLATLKHRLELKAHGYTPDFLTKTHPGPAYLPIGLLKTKSGEKRSASVTTGIGMRPRPGKPAEIAAAMSQADRCRARSQASAVHKAPTAQLKCKKRKPAPPQPGDIITGLD